MEELQGKVAFITGGASGMGRAMVKSLAAAGMKVVAADIEPAALDALAAEFTGSNAEVVPMRVDVSDRDAMEAAAARTVETFGKVHVLCNNAGVAAMTPGRAIWEVPRADWDWVRGVNFDGVLYGLRAFLPHMLAHGEEGHVVNTASLAGLMPGGGTYGVSKHGVLSLTETLYNDLAARNASIGASVLCPGMVSTNIFDAERNRPATLRSDAPRGTDEMMEMGRAMLAQGKAPAEIAEIVLQAIRTQSLYVLPHPAWDELVRARIDAVLARGGPMKIDFPDMMRRRAQGEQF
jgi:NAD(P)-dependent dehydrogenase (short-subunit alcohol dehydrogenase family)